MTESHTIARASEVLFLMISLFGVFYTLRAVKSVQEDAIFQPKLSKFKQLVLLANFEREIFKLVAQLFLLIAAVGSLAIPNDPDWLAVRIITNRSTLIIVSLILAFSTHNNYLKRSRLVELYEEEARKFID